MNELDITSSQGFRVKLTPMHSLAPLQRIASKRESVANMAVPLPVYFIYLKYAVNYNFHEQRHRFHEQTHRVHEQTHRVHKQRHRFHEQRHRFHEQTHRFHEQNYLIKTAILFLPDATGNLLLHRSTLASSGVTRLKCCKKIVGWVERSETQHRDQRWVLTR
ncbi:hypothetical protein [Nostoc sp. C117]|uniref:hypothetical protein n=1 Tax=Nostoc sp. C117 TaxID=3349875 RepID=UPI00370D6212